MLRRLLWGAAALVTVGALLFMVFGALTLVLAVVGPLMGLSYLGLQVRAARGLWASRGRLPIADGVRVVNARRTQGLALSHLLAGLGGLSIGLAPAAFLFGPDGSWMPLLGVGVLAASTGAAASDRLLRGARGVDVLPPER